MILSRNIESVLREHLKLTKLNQLEGGDDNVYPEVRLSSLMARFMALLIWGRLAWFN